MKKKFLAFLCLMICSSFLIACGNKSNVNDANNISNSNFYNSTNKEDKKFNTMDELNENSSEFTNTTKLDVVPQQDRLPQTTAGSTETNINRDGDTLTPEEADKEVVEEVFECDVLEFGGNQFYIPLIDGLQIAEYTENFTPTFQEGITTLATDSTNEDIVYIKVAAEGDFSEDDLWNKLDSKYLELSKDNTAIGLTLSDWEKTTSYDFEINYRSISWNTVENALVSHTTMGFAWAKLGNIYVLIEYQTNNLDETITIEYLAKNFYKNFLYVNEML